MRENIKWHKGFPPFPYNDEWFIAKLSDGSVVELLPLPEEWSYDWMANDRLETYYTDKRIKEIVLEWAQKDNSQYVDFVDKRKDE